jgi:hypothetical protein
MSRERSSKAPASAFPRPEKYVILFMNSGTWERKEPNTSYRLFNPARLEAKLAPGYFLAAASRLGSWIFFATCGAAV